MDEHELKQLVIKNAKVKMPVENIKDKTLLLYDLGYDSTMTIRLLVEIEKALDIKFDDEELSAENLSTFKNLKEIVAAKLR